MNKKIPDYYIRQDNITYYLVFLFFFSLIFVNIFTPFKGAWYNIQNCTRLQLFTDTLMIITGGIVVMIISRVLMYFVNRSKRITLFWYCFWQLIEILLIAFLYAFICKYAVGDTRSFTEIFARSLVYVPLIVVIPAVISHLFFSTIDKNQKLMVLTDISIDDMYGDEFILDNHITQLKKRDELTGNQENDIKKTSIGKISEPSTTSDNGRIINFLDEKDELQISLKTNNIYYIESAENYINIFYNNKGTVERFTMRSSLKKQFDKLEKSGFIRSHRSYVVNFSNIAMLKRSKDGPYLDFGVSGLKEVPISKTYIDSVTQYFLKNSGD